MRVSPDPRLGTIGTTIGTTAVVALAGGLGLFGLVGCGNGEASSAPAPAPTAAAAPAPADPARVPNHPGMTGGVREGSTDDSEGATALKLGDARWKDTAVYADGKPIGVLAFGELPIGLAPVWVEDQISIPVKAGHKGPAYKIVKQRQYRFTDYLVAVGVDLKKVKELHVYGPKFTETIIVSGDELMKRGREFYFRFGGEVSGKAIPHVPDDFGNGKTPDKVSAVMVYLEKTPPTLIRNKGMELDGKLVTDVPYYGEPLRGGIHIYVDNKFAALIKRKLLQDGTLAETTADGTVRWRLLPFLAAQGIDTKAISEIWIIRQDRRREKLTRAELENITFEASPAARGEILIGEQKIAANALALHSKPLRPDQLPQVLPDEEDRVVAASPTN